MGRAVVLTGGNKVAARLAGIPISRTIVFIYAVSGVMSAIGAVVLVSRVTLADPTMGTPYTTQAILAVVVGGTALIGGRGSVLWTVVGTLLLILLNNCLNLLGVSSYIQFMLRGVILILAIWLDRVKQDAVRSSHDSTSSLELQGRPIDEVGPRHSRRRSWRSSWS